MSDAIGMLKKLADEMRAYQPFGKNDDSPWAARWTATLDSALRLLGEGEPVGLVEVDRHGDQHYRNLDDLPAGKHFVYTRPPTPTPDEAVARAAFHRYLDKHETGLPDRVDCYLSGYRAALLGEKS